MKNGSYFLLQMIISEYVKNRLKVQSLFVELIYSLFNHELTNEEKVVPFKHILMLNAFKDASWEHEKEKRAIFYANKNEFDTNGKPYSFDEIGVKPTKILSVPVATINMLQN